MNIVGKLEHFIKRYVSFPEDSGYSLPLALWAIATYTSKDFDSFPYLVITSETKRSGKTRLAEILSFICASPVFAAALSAAALFRTMDSGEPTLFFDEAEALNSESASIMRSVLNAGYRRGSTVRRVSGKDVVEFRTYGPKVFILIGDVYDTLKDRSIIVRMRRAGATERFLYETTKTEGMALQAEISSLGLDTIVMTYLSMNTLEFLTDRDAEIWAPLFAVAKVLCPERITELRRTAVDMATLKTQDSARYVNLLGAEKASEEDEYALRLLHDTHAVVRACGHRNMGSAAIVEALRQLDTAPWRVFRGEGITVHNLADMLARFRVNPITVRLGTGRSSARARGFKLADLATAIARHPRR